MANEVRLIDANALLQKLSRMIDYCKTDNKVTGLVALFQVGDAIIDCNTVDAVEVVHGRWVHVDDAEYKCNQCKKHVCFDELIDRSVPAYNYCPNCGASMKDGDENG